MKCIDLESIDYSYKIFCLFSHYNKRDYAMIWCFVIQSILCGGMISCVVHIQQAKDVFLLYCSLLSCKCNEAEN